MPRKRSAIGVSTPAARRMAARAARGQSSRTLENPQQSQARLQSDRLRHRVQRASEDPQQSQARLQSDRLRHRVQRASEDPQQSQARLQSDRLRHRVQRASEDPQQSQARLQSDRLRHKVQRASEDPQQSQARLQSDRLRHRVQRASEDPQQSQARLQSDRLRHRVQRASENPQQSQARLQSDRLRHRVQRASETPQQSQTRQEADQLQYFSRVVLPGCMPTFKVQGQVYHRIGSVLPPLNSDSRQLQPAFLQVFFIGDSSAEVATRHRNFPITKPHIVSILQDMLHRYNPYVHLFKASIEKMPSPDYKLVIKADKAPPGHHPRTFNAPTINEVAIVIVQENCDRRDIVLSKRGSGVQRINEFHRSNDALQYPLVFWNGQDGYHFHIPQLINEVPSAHKTVSCMDFYASLLMIRSRNPGITNWLLAFGNLTHQILVDIYAKVESERLHYISAHQAQLRATEYINLLDAIRTDRSHALIGRQVILPSFFVGSPRHMHEYAQDCMAYVRKYGRPDLFITFTCNPEWPEIKLMQFTTQGAFVRHDLVARIFQLKVTKLIDLITKGDVFGKRPNVGVIPLNEKIRPNQIDSIICAEIPNAEVDASLFRTVTKNMIHGPCGHGYPNPCCMERGRCQKKYPRLLLAETQTDRDGYPLYRRRRPEEGGFSFVKRVRVFTIEHGVQVVRMTNVTCDNRYVVPYSPLLCRLFDAHINVESCASISAIKYICKYIYKGSDQSIFAVSGAQTESNEVLEYQSGRYISSNEAVWRILGVPIHRRHPMVQHLSVHLENGQRVYFTSANAALQGYRPPKTTLTEFFALCQRDNFAKTLLYVEVPVYYIWSASKSWQPRKQGTRIADQVAFASDAIGRVYTVHPNFEECFYLRMLLHSVRGPTSFAGLRKINGVLCQTYKEACLHLGLLENDQQWHHCIQEAVLSESPLKIRELFAIILTCCHPTNPQDIWAQFKEPMSADILNLARQQANDGLLQLTSEMSNQALILLEQKVLQMTGFHLTKFGMRSPQRNVTHRTSHELLRETSYDFSRLLQFVASNEPKLANVPEQKEACDRILSKIDSNAGGLYFIDAPGGTGKTFLINLLLTKVRSTGDIALSTASSGIAATLLHGGRTAHSTFKLPLDLTRDEVPVCNLNADSAMGEVLRQCKFIVWDECTMAHRHALEAVDITLKDCRQDQRPMGEATILTCCFQNEEVFIPRIPLIHDDKHSPLHFKRLQFPIRVSFAMSINKAQAVSEEDESKHFAIKISKTQSKRELDILNQVQSENVIKLFDGVVAKGKSIFIMEYCPLDLLGLINNGHRIELSEDEIRHVWWQIGSGIKHLHNLRIMHRDVKPSNICVTFEGDFKLIDFEFASKYIEGKSFNFPGTMGYQAPEIMLSNKYYDLKVDVWSMGIVFAETYLGDYLIKNEESNKVLDELYEIFGYSKVQEAKAVKESNPANNIEGASFIERLIRYTVIKIIRSLPVKYNIELDLPIFKDIPSLPKSLILKLLECNPEQRISSEQCLTHEFFSGARKAPIQAIIRALEERRKNKRIKIISQES
ncbi:hypothetical protein LAZ67_6003542 [Cordylochernes scorpioides]|uniref:ATP-dependent DNA helicase n=1 Tax=Cordylochernes scorpioides TaxID=51811 RepID=A0ABY6KM42_9ARAC|nr:hypothetical protein LAZ67_6003542 [Cordylochernes scorpioides]